MRGHDLLEIIENLNPAYIENASRKPKSRKPSWQKWGAIAACLVLILSLGIWGIQRLPAGDSGMQGEYMADREPIIVTIKEIKDDFEKTIEKSIEVDDNFIKTNITWFKRLIGDILKLFAPLF